MEHLYTPWRYSYITQSSASPENPATPKDSGCFFCSAARAPEDPDGLVVHTAGHHLVMLNLHPYSNGHLMIAPFEHESSPQESAPEARAELWPLVLKCHRVLQEAYSPDGFNFGMNLGRQAGAGVPGHFHFHLVPRWAGDTNFMTVVAEVRLIPEDLRHARERLRALFGREEAYLEDQLGST
jgi:ATP adenylyltransferase